MLRKSAALIVAASAADAFAGSTGFMPASSGTWAFPRWLVERLAATPGSCEHAACLIHLFPVLKAAYNQVPTSMARCTVPI